MPRTCPFTGTEFRAVVPASGTRFCQRLDMKPIGAIAAPAQPPICPDDGFVLYKETFTSQELERLRRWVASDEFRRMVAEESVLYRVARTQEQLSEDADAVAWSYVQASWEVEGDAERYARYLGLALAAIDRYLAKIESGWPPARSAWSRETALVLAGELERRRADFDAARRRLERAAASVVPGSHLAEILEIERRLFEAADSGRHYHPAEEQERCAAHDRIPRSNREGDPGEPP